MCKCLRIYPLLTVPQVHTVPFSNAIIRSFHKKDEMSLLKTSILALSPGSQLPPTDPAGAASSPKEPSQRKNTEPSKQSRKELHASPKPIAPHRHHCPTCMKSFLARIGLLRHLQTHHSSPTDWLPCSWSFSTTKDEQQEDVYTHRLM